jgi:hypothetical protein
VWRYGRHLRTRYFRAARGWTLGAMGTGGITGAMLAGVLSPFAAVAGVAMGAAVLHLVRRELVVDRIFGNAGLRYSVRRGDVPDARVIANEDGRGWSLLVEHAWGATHVEGDAAHAALARLLVHLNRRGASEHSVSRALARLETASCAEEFIASVARRADRALAIEAEELRRRDWSRAVTVEDARATLGDLDFYYRVALEMALHESMERQALAGELRVLEHAWREAECVAAIADDLLLPTWIREYVRRESALQDRVGK